MNPALIFALFDGFLSLVEKLAPTVLQLVQRGDITIEQQALLRARIQSLQAGDLFSGPEWQQSSSPLTPTPKP